MWICGCGQISAGTCRMAITSCYYMVIPSLHGKQLQQWSSSSGFGTQRRRWAVALLLMRNFTHSKVTGTEGLEKIRGCLGRVKLNLIEYIQCRSHPRHPVLFAWTDDDDVWNAHCPEHSLSGCCDLWIGMVLMCMELHSPGDYYYYYDKMCQEDVEYRANLIDEGSRIFSKHSTRAFKFGMELTSGT